MPIKIKKILTGLLAFMLLLFQMPAVISAASIDDAIVSSEPAPITAAPVLDGDDGRVGDTITVTVKNGINYLFLPSCANASKVAVCYTGSEALYNEKTGKTIQNGQTDVYDFSAGDVCLYEYNASKDQYTKYSLRVMKSAEVSSLHFTIDDVPGEKDILEYLHANKENRTTGALVMMNAAGEVVYNGGVDTFKGRGNTSFVAPGIVPDKKSYNFKLGKKAELIDGAGKMKKWSLLHMRVSTAYYYDWTGMCARLGFQTYNQLAKENRFDMRAEYVDVYINQEYRGTYILTERMDVNAAVDISKQDDYVQSESSAKTTVKDKQDAAIQAGIQYYRYTTDAAPIPDSGYDITGGYLLEVHFGSLEDCGFVTKNGMYVNIKAPEACTKEQVQYIAKYVQDFENALMSDTGYNSEGKYYTEYIDAESLASLILTYAFYQNWELFRTSTYMYKDTADSAHSTLTFGPAWDFETGDYILKNDKTLFGTHNVYSDKQQYVWLEPLWQKGDFMSLVFAKEKELNALMTSVLADEAGSPDALPEDVFTASELIEGAMASQAMNWARWDFKKIIDGLSGHAGKENTFAYFADQYRSALQTRLQNWTALWDDSQYLLGVSIAGYRDADGKIKLVSHVNTTQEVSYTWYKLNENKTAYIPIDGADGATLLAEDEGIYYCVVSGKNNACYRQAKGSVFSKEIISMTALFDTANAVNEGEHPDCEHETSEWKRTVQPTCAKEGLEEQICTQCGFVLDTRTVSKAAHTPGEWEIVTAPTTEEEGLQTKSCTVCGEELERQVLDRIYVNPFTDVDTEEWYGAAVQYAVQNQLFFGFSDTIFSPDTYMTRGMLVSVLARLEGIEVDNSQKPAFDDVERGIWYNGAVIWAAEHDLVAGTSKTTFEPEENITREQTAAILYRYALYKGYDCTEKNSISHFSDYRKVSSYAVPALSWANKHKIVNGTSNTVLDPSGFSTRAQVALMMMNFCQAYNHS
ncbi:MAG: hypothetical protein HFE78_07205 [Clostridiales bacterium]|nr:hypothetical protein [Clostridiales bacterium]